MFRLHPFSGRLGEVRVGLRLSWVQVRVGYVRVG